MTALAAELDPEQQVVGAILATSGACLDDLSLSASEFAQPALGQVFSAAVLARSEGAPCDPASLASRLAADPEWRYPATVLTDALGALTTAASVGWHAAEVRKAHRLRQAAACGSRMVQAATSPGAEPDRITDLARRFLDDLDSGTASADLTDGTGLGAAAVEAIEGQVRAIPTPWEAVNHPLVGWVPGRLYVVAARPGVGKSVALAQAVADLTVCRGVPALLCSLEMSAVEVGQRMLCSLGSVAHHRMARNELTDAEWRAVVRAQEHLGLSPITVADRPGMTVADVRAAARQAARRHGPLGLVAVDYLQLLRPGGKSESRQVEVAEMSRGLKLLARELEVPMLVAAQLNRKSEERADRKPRLSDLRESGAVEQDADVVLLLHREDDLANDCEVIVAKNRHGATGAISLVWDGEHARMRDRLGGVA